MRKQACIGFIAAVLMAVAFGTTAADDPWPSRPIRVITPSAAGGTGDVLAREFSQRLSERIKQPVIVENRPGGNGIIATTAVKNAPADGYTLLFTLTQHIQVPMEFKDAGYDAVTDFTPIARIGATATVVVTRASLGANTVADLQRIAKGKTLTFGTTATGPQVVMEVFNRSAELGMTNVPYKGEAPALTDLLGGQIDMALLSVATAKGYIEKGMMKPVAVIFPGRVPALPDVPNFTELGFNDVNWYYGWYGFLAPAKLPEPVAARLIAEMRTIAADPAVRKKLEDLNMNVTYMFGAEFGQQIQKDIVSWGALVKRSGVGIQR